jgi:hypothetical protein
VTLGPMALRGEIGATLFKNALNASYVVLNYEAFLRMSLLPNVGLELGGGLQNWTQGNGGSAGVLSAGLTFGLVGFFDRVYATYSRFLLGSDVNELKLGVGLIF